MFATKSKLLACWSLIALVSACPSNIQPLLPTCTMGLIHSFNVFLLAVLSAENMLPKLLSQALDLCLNFISLGNISDHLNQHTHYYSPSQYPIYLSIILTVSVLFFLFLLYPSRMLSSTEQGPRLSYSPWLPRAEWMDIQ